MSHDPLLSQIRDDAKEAYHKDREPVVVELLTAYLRHVPDDAYAWYMQGDALRIVGRFREAEHALLQALELAPDDKRISVYARLAQLYNDIGSYAEAEHYYSQVADHDEWQALGWVWILRGSNLARLGNFELAEKCHRHATTLVDVHADEAWLNLGLVLRAQGKYTAARRALKKSLARDPCCAVTQEALKSLQGIEEAMAAAALVEKLDNGEVGDD